MPKVSFILPALGNCSDEVEMARLCATESDEIIVVNGGEPSPQDVDLYIEESDDNPTHAANKGVFAASGDFIKFIGKGDIHHRQEFRTAVTLMEEYDIDLLQCGGKKTLNGDSVWVWWPEGINYGSQYGDPLQYGASAAGAIYRRSMFARTGIFDPRFQMSDVEIVIRAIIAKANVKFARVNAFSKELDSVIKNKDRIRDETLFLMAQYGIPPLQRFERIENPVWDGGFS